MRRVNVASGVVEKIVNDLMPKRQNILVYSYQRWVAVINSCWSALRDHYHEWRGRGNAGATLHIFKNSFVERHIREWMVRVKNWRVSQFQAARALRVELVAVPVVVRGWLIVGAAAAGQEQQGQEDYSHGTA